MPWRHLDARQLSWVFDFKNGGICREITDRLDARGARHGGDCRDFVYEPDAMKIVLEDMASEAGAELLYFTNCAGAHVAGGVMKTLLTESKSGRQAWGAKIFIDCTGDGDVCARAGRLSRWARRATARCSRARSTR